MKVAAGVRGFYKLEAFKADPLGREIAGSRRTAADWFPNLITDGGLDYMGANASYLEFCQVGSGATPPTVSDTALASRVSSTSTTSSNTTGAQAASPYFGWRRKTFRFGEGAAAGNLTEVGVGWATTGGLYSRALILDPGGTPTTISVGLDESLDVTYELRFYIPEIDGSGTINIGGVDYDWTARAANASSSSIWTGQTSGGLIGMSSAIAYSGSIGAITGVPSGSSQTISVSRDAYASNSLKIGATVTAGLAQGNIAGGIKSIYVFGAGGSIGGFQIEFDVAIPKDATKIFSLGFDVSWARQP